MILYHASQKKNLKQLKPQKTLSDNKYIGEFVFATSNKKLAVMYLVPKGIATLMNPHESNPNIVICAESENFLRLDIGGAIYEIPGKNFTQSPQIGLIAYEMVSTKTVKPLNALVFDSTIDALLLNGIKIRFTTEKIFKSLIRNPDQDKMIEKLKLFTF